MKNNEAVKKLTDGLKKYKYVLLVMLAGVILILLPTGGGTEKASDSSTSYISESPEFSLSEEERKISEALSKIDGAGNVTVVLTLKTGTEQVLAVDENISVSKGSDGSEVVTDRKSETVVISSCSSVQETVPLKYIYPEYLGALVVAEGAGNPQVELQLIRAVTGLTGLKTDKVTVTKMKDS